MAKSTWISRDNCDALHGAKMPVTVYIFFFFKQKTAYEMSVSDWSSDVCSSDLVSPFVVKHASGAPAYALRVEYGGKVITYSGDTEWTESLIEAARGADLFICEAYFFEKKIKYHLDYQTLRENRHRLDCRRVVLTHMSADMLTRQAEVEIECADDGQVIVP